MSGLMRPVELRNRVVGAVTSDVREFDGRLVVWVDVDAGSRVGALTSDSSGKIEHASTTARAKGFPLIVIMRSSGADIVEGFAALHGWGLAARALTDCSGVVPIIMVVEGPAVSGPALLLGMADFVVMTVDSYAFVTGPTMVAEFTGVMIDNDELGGAASHARYTGAASLVAPDLDTAIEMVASAARLPPAAQRRGATAVADRRSARSADTRGRGVDAADIYRELRRSRRHPGDLRRRGHARTAWSMGTERRHGLRRHGRYLDRHRRQSAARPRRHARYPGITEGGAIRGVLRCVQHPHPHPRRHALASIRARTSNGAG